MLTLERWQKSERMRIDESSDETQKNGGIRSVIVDQSERILVHVLVRCASEGSKNVVAAVVTYWMGFTGVGTRLPGPIRRRGRGLPPAQPEGW